MADVSRETSARGDRPAWGRTVGGEIDMNERRHQWVSGMIIVHEEDLEYVADARRASGSSLPECERCGHVYSGPDCADTPCKS